MLSEFNCIKLQNIISFAQINFVLIISQFLCQKRIYE